ncbi:toxin-antitoxin system YwqK family antitoxin [Pontibacter sp. CAU 1760]
MRHSLLLYFSFVAGMGMLLLGGCGQPKWNSDYLLNQARLKDSSKAEVLASGDTINVEIEERTALTKEDLQEDKKRKKKKYNKKYFLGQKVKRGFIKSGRGSRETLETFSYLDSYQDPDPYAPLKYLYDTKKRKLYRTSSDEADANRYKLLHGPYEKKINGQVVEEGYFYVGTKHLRWEKYRPDEEGTLVDKNHYEKGFVRDAVISYYGDTKKIKEVIPYQYGQVEGTYYRFYENGQVQWSGQYEKGRKVGTWVNYYDFRGRRHYEYQYPKTAYDSRFEPFLVKEYDRHGTLIYEKDKLDKRSQAQR